MFAAGRSLPEISKKLGISERMVYRWHKKRKPLSANQREENQDLQPDNDGLKTLLGQMERASLKKALRSTPQPFSASLNDEIFIQQGESLSLSSEAGKSQGLPGLQSHRPGSGHQQGLQAVVLTVMDYLIVMRAPNFPME